MRSACVTGKSFIEQSNSSQLIQGAQQAALKVVPGSLDLLIGILKNKNLTQYFFQFINLKELTALHLVCRFISAVTTQTRNSIFTKPDQLLHELGLLSAKNLAGFIRDNKRIASIMQNLSDAGESQPAAYACWAIMSPNINLLDSERLQNVIKALLAINKSYPARIITSLEIIAHALARDFLWINKILIQYDNLYVNLGFANLTGFSFHGKLLNGNPNNPMFAAFIVKEYDYLNLMHANLQNVKFNYQVITAVNMMGANLKNADFTSAIFSNVNIADTDMTGAVIKGKRHNDAYHIYFENGYINSYNQGKADKTRFFSNITLFSKNDLVSGVLAKKIKRCFDLDIWPDTIVKSFAKFSDENNPISEDEKANIIYEVAKIKEFTAEQLIEIIEGINLISSDRKMDLSQMSHAIYVCVSLLNQLDSKKLVQHIVKCVEHDNCGYSYTEKYNFLNYLQKHEISKKDTRQLKTLAAFFANLPKSDQQIMIGDSIDRLNEIERTLKYSK